MYGARIPTPKIQTVRVWRLIGLSALASWVGAALLRPLGPVVDQVSNGVLGILLVVNWVGAVYLWSAFSRKGIRGVVTLIFLVPLGLLWGWIYVIVISFNTGSLTYDSPSS